MRLADLPNTELERFLVSQKGFTESGAERFVKNFRVTMRYAGLDDTSDYTRVTAWNNALQTINEQ